MCYVMKTALLLVVQCAALEDGTNTVSVDNTSPYEFGNTYTYVCNEGYEYSGELVSTCQSDRTWSLVAPTCAGKIYNTAYPPSKYLFLICLEKFQ